MPEVNFMEAAPKVEEFLELADDLGFVIASRLDPNRRACQNCKTRYPPKKTWQKFCSKKCNRNAMRRSRYAALNPGTGSVT